MKYVAKTAVQHDDKLYPIGETLPALTEAQAADLLALGAIEAAPEDKTPEGKPPVKAKAREGAE